MTPPNKIKVSITLSADLLRAVDREAAREGQSTRSSVIDAWLRRGRRRVAEARLASETIAYYRAQTDAEREDDGEWSAYASQTFEALDDE